MMISARYLRLFIFPFVLFACALPVLAATIELRATGQTSQYANGDDGSKLRGATWPTPRFVDNGDRTVTDTLTGLMWTIDCNLPVGGRTWQQALDYVASMNKGTGTYGHNDWRLPTVNELQSLVNAQQPNMARWLDASRGFGNPFANVQSGCYWSSTTYAANTSSAWGVCMDFGSLAADHKTKNLYVWPVRAGQPSSAWKTGQTARYYAGDDGNLRPGVAWPALRFTDNGNGTVTDNLTGLLWLKNANCTDSVGGINKAGGYLTWANALAWSYNLANGSCGLTDGSLPGHWRLPNREELYSLNDFSRYGPALPAGHPFLNVSLSYYWSSSTYAANTSNAWGVYMNYGYWISHSKTIYNYVWPVRGGGLFGSAGISVSPNAYDFENIKPGSSSSSRTLTVTNTGTNTLHIKDIAKTGPDPDQFGIQRNNCANTAVAPSGTCTIDVIFAPTSARSMSTSLSILSNAPSGPAVVKLTGSSNRAKANPDGP